jgi:hypothetical protein
MSLVSPETVPPSVDDVSALRSRLEPLFHNRERSRLDAREI